MYLFQCRKGKGIGADAIVWAPLRIVSKNCYLFAAAITVKLYDESRVLETVAIFSALPYPLSAFLSNSNDLTYTYRGWIANFHSSMRSMGLKEEKYRWLRRFNDFRKRECFKKKYI